VKRLSAKAIVTVETGAGPEAGFPPDDAYANAGAHRAGLQQVLDGSADLIIIQVTWVSERSVEVKKKFFRRIADEILITSGSAVIYVRVAPRNSGLA
jgi:NAD/NADP transhydrogenase alpha subunit